jgi:hypothetical protein
LAKLPIGQTFPRTFEQFLDDEEIIAFCEAKNILKICKQGIEETTSERPIW